VIHQPSSHEDDAPRARRRRVASALAAALALAAASRTLHATTAPATARSYADRDDVMAFAAAVAARRRLDPGWVRGQIAQARRQPAVERAIMPPPPGMPRNWSAYRDRFVEPRRIAAGAEFWERHAAVLDVAEARWGVPPEIVVGIVGVETFYGRHLGTFRVIDALTTLGFDFPAGRSDRSDYFRGEIEEFLVLCDRERLDPQQVRGSFAGAIGWPQFMPGSINRWGLDFDDDGRVDLLGNPVDAIGSIAYYLADHGWERGLPTHYAIDPPADAADRAALLAPDIVPSFTAGQMSRLGARLDAAGARHDGLLALVLLEDGTAPPLHVAGTRNFWVVTRYNRSSFYALAVITLGDAVRRARGADTVNR
jgi:membrane-bound lytic murein transglycosylase B